MRSASFHRQVMATSGGHPYLEADAIHTQSLPFSLVSLSASEVVGKAKYRHAAFRLIARFDVQASHGQKLHYRIYSGVSECTPSPVEVDILAKSVADAFAQVDASVIPGGVVDIRLIPREVSLSRLTVSFNLGKKVSLRFYRACHADAEHESVADLLGATSVSMHEMTHVIDNLYLRDMPNQSTRQLELLADYAVGCLYESLERSAPGRDMARQYPLADFYNENAIETGGAQTNDATESCKMWSDWVSRSRQ
jgi:hypothetical protein